MVRTTLTKPEAFLDIFAAKPDDDKQNTTYCPGCGHGILHKLIGEALSDLGIIDRAVLVAPVGCAVFMYYYYKSCGVQAAHGRAPAVGTGISRAHPDSIVISYQGDGDLAAIGTNQIMQAANRGEQMAVIFVNNAVYGMTGGQMAPTSLLGQRTTTSPHGRLFENEGAPLRMAEIIATLDAPVYVERASLTSTGEIMKVRASIRKCLQAQIDRKGFTFLEVLSQCPSCLKLQPTEVDDWIRENMFPVFERCVFKDKLQDAPPIARKRKTHTAEELYDLMGIENYPETQQGAQPMVERPDSTFTFAGFGGQGILTLGVVVAQAGLVAGYRATWLPSYGPEMRGGTAYSSVVLSDRSIGSPLVQNPDVLIAMNAPSFQKFLPAVAPGGLVLYNSSLIKDIPEPPSGVRLVGLPAVELAERLGEPRAANIIMVGALGVLSDIFTRDDLDTAIRRHFAKGLDINLSALAMGAEYAQKMQEA